VRAQPFGTVRVMLKRGLRDVGALELSRCWGVLKVGRGDDSLLLVPLLLVLLPEVPELVGGELGPLISVVDTCGVLVIVSVVVVETSVGEVVDENDGSTNWTGAVVDSSGWVTYMIVATRTPRTATPAMLAPTTARVELCQGSCGSSPPNSSTNSSLSNSSSRSGPATNRY
jgi:hypothetical protein